ncbi:MAG: hypothetical protein V5A44_12050 [Haloarculaceae archaeon]
MGRGQANLLALVAALFALTTAMVVGVVVADGALASAARDSDERHAAVAVADRLVAADSPLTNRTNVVDGSAVDEVTATRLRSRYPVLDDRAVRVTLGDETLASAGRPVGGTTIRRIVLVERTQQLTIRPRFSGANQVTLPRRTERVELTVDPPENVSVETVRANGRTVLYSPDNSLDGTYEVRVSRRETVELRFDANDTLSRGDVTVTLYPWRTNKRVLGVTVDD